MKKQGNQSICGLWVSKKGEVWLSYRGEGDTRNEVKYELAPFAWIKEKPIDYSALTKSLGGSGSLRYILEFTSADSYFDFIKGKGNREGVEVINPLEHQWLLKNQKRMFEGMSFMDLRRCQVDIETGCLIKGSFSDARRAGDRILGIGIRMNGKDKCLVLEENSDNAEATLLESFNEMLQQMDPDVIEGHNIFKFDLDYLRIRCKRLGIPCNWGRFGQEVSFRSSRLKVAERWIDFNRCDISGRTVLDTYLMVQLYDVTKRELPGYSLKAVAAYFGISDAEDGSRTYIQGNEIQDAFYEDRERFLAYLQDDLRETEGLGNILLPTYYAQVMNFPMTLQEALLRGSSQKLELMFLEQYYHAEESLPEPPAIGRFEGGYTQSFHVGVYSKVLHYDVASLYPSLLLSMGRAPRSDSLGCFLNLLKLLKEYRLEYKKKAQVEKNLSLKIEYEARQASFKILINSFYGYLGFSGARFADGLLAAEITARGRDLLKCLIANFESIGCEVLEADTDGLYVSANEYYDSPETLLNKVSKDMPVGITLEYSGKYAAMFCYKAKNYALYDGSQVIIRGSGLKSRGMEPFLKELTYEMVHYLLGASDVDPSELVEKVREEIKSGKMDIKRLARSENLSQNPDLYAKKIEEGKKSRRASLEVALKKGGFRMGDKVTYFIAIGEKSRMPDWEVARLIEDHDPVKLTYDKKYYLRKLDDWLKRYVSFFKNQPNDPIQGELL